MNIILLSGGSGKRLWPLSNDVRSKQFIKIFKNEQGDYESMVQRVYRQIKSVDTNAKIIIATAQAQVPAIHNQLGNNVGVSVEPSRRDTFPAIVLATAYLCDVQGVDINEPVVVCPVDPYVETEYFAMLQKLSEQVQKEKANLVLMGIEPTYPSEKYGYIMPKDKEAVSEVSEFKEKPDLAKAKEYIAQGALWNAGVFAFKPKYVLQKAKEMLGTSNYQELFANYDNLEKISFDYAVVEKEKSIQVMRYSGEWKDLGTWNTLTEAMSENVVGEGILGDCENVHIVNELNMPLFAMGLKDVVISASPDGIIVSDKEKSSYIKPYVEQIHQRPMYEEREWGTYRVLDHQENSLTKELVLKPGKNISYQRHSHRKEVWTFIQGEGLFLLNGEIKKVQAGDTVIIPVGAKHALKAVTELHFIEVQVGKPLIEEDIERFEWVW